MIRKKLYLIDATAFCYRAFYALSSLATSSGQPTNAVYGFLNILNKILKEKNPDYLAICFDVSRETFRTKKYAEYKIQRPPMPDGLSSQIPIIKELIRAYGLSIFEKEGFEADDIIATIVKKAKDEDIDVTIVSSDKDILQLVGGNTEVFSPYKDEGIIYNKEKVIERFGVEPEKIPDIMALMGDSVDNIPGVSGIGEKTASELISKFGSVDELLKEPEKIKKEKIRQAVIENTDKIKLNRELAGLDENVELDFSLEALKSPTPDYAELAKIFKRLEFKRFLKELPQEDSRENISSSELPEEELRALYDNKAELIFYPGQDAGFIVNLEDKFFNVAAGDVFKNILEDSSVKKTSHNLKSVKIELAKKGINLSGIYFDTMIAAYLLNPAKPGYGLEDLALDYLDTNLAAKSLEPLQALSLIVKLRPKLEDELSKKSLGKLFNELEMPLVEVLAGIEINGIRLDTKVLKELSSDIERRLIKLIENIYKESGSEFNINSPKQLAEVLFERLKLPVVKKGKTGPSTDEEVLRKLSGKHNLPALLLEYRQLTKLKNTYIDTLPVLIEKDTGRIHASFNQTGTETGRLSSSEPNLQNIPVKGDIGKQIRRSIIAYDSKSLLLSCDYSQVELRILAHLSKDESLIDAFKKGKDVHRITAALIYGMSEKDVNEEMRETAKRVNFGIVYGLTSFGLSRDLNIPVEEAQAFIEAYFARYPRVKEYIQNQIEKAKQDGFVTTILGRRRYIPEINNKNIGLRQFAERQAVNTPIQGSASDLIKMAMVAIADELKSGGLKAKMIMQIHDELVFNVPEDELGLAVNLIKNSMENVLKLDVPIKVDIKKGRNWLEMEEVK